LRHLERIKSGYNGEKQAHSDRLASTCFATD
jgi:hypothetical protein